MIDFRIPFLAKACMSLGALTAVHKISLAGNRITSADICPSVPLLLQIHAAGLTIFQNQQGITTTTAVMRIFFFLLILLSCFSAGNCFSLHAAAAGHGETTPSFATVYHIPLRIHLGGSARPVFEWLIHLEEINAIWYSQAAICFDMHTVLHDETMTDGFDLWFESHIPGWNGYYADTNDMHVRDNPDLRPAEHPAQSSAARTAAHELGHALGLAHRQNSDNNLMRSKTYGWQLNAEEIVRARATAARTYFTDSNTLPCSPPAIGQES